MHDPVKITDTAQLRRMPNTAGPGVYIIYSSTQPWYVGVAGNYIRDRFLQRLKVLNDFNLPSSILSDRSIVCVELLSSQNCGLMRKARGLSSPATQYNKPNPMLNVIEQFFIAQCKTNLGRGNASGEPVRIAGSGTLTIVVQKTDGTTKTYTCTAKPGKGPLPGIGIDSRKGQNYFNCVSAAAPTAPSARKSELEFRTQRRYASLPQPLRVTNWG